MSRGIFTTISGAVTAAIKTAQATADNARQMVINRDPRLTTLEGVASAFTAATASADAVHSALGARIDAVINDIRSRFAALPAPVTTTLQVEYRDGIAVPPITSLLGISASADVTITWPTPFADTGYIVTPQVATATPALIGKTTATLKTKTTTGCIVTVTTTALVGAGQATVSAVAYRKS
jgi:hypothetical protein